jgi:hypothetical protein
MKILVLAILAVAVWLLVGYTFQHRNDNTVPAQTAAQIEQGPTPPPMPPARTRLPAPGTLLAPPPPATPAASTPVAQPVAHTGPPVLFHGRISQKTPEGDLLIVCEKTFAVKDGHYALENPWRGAQGSSELAGEFLIVGDPEAGNLVDGDPVGGIGEFGGPYAFNTPQGGLRNVRKILWVDPKTVPNYQPQDPAAAAKSKLTGSALDQKPHR